MYKKEFKTRFNSATDTTGESITAFLIGFDGAGTRYNIKQKTMPYNYAHDGFENHIKAVENLEGVELELTAVKEFKRGYRFEQLID